MKPEQEEYDQEASGNPEEPEFDMSTLLSDDDGEESEYSAEIEEEEVPSEEPPSEPEEAPQQGEAAEEPAEEPEEPAVSETPEETPAPEEETPEPSAEETQPLTQEEWNRQFQENREAAITELEQRYALDEETRDQILSEPEKVLPRMAANVFMDAYQYVFREVMGVLPNMVQQIQQQQTQTQQREQEFFGKFEGLNDDMGRKTVQQVAQTMAPQAQNMDREKFHKAVALQSYIMLNRQLPQNLLDGVVPEQQGNPPEAPPQAHRPASPGAPRAPSMPAQTSDKDSDNIFAQLAEEDWD